MDAQAAFATAAPAPALAACVDRYVGYRMEGLAPGAHQALPSRHLTLIVSLAEPVELSAMPDGRQAPASFSALVAGLHAAPGTVRVEDRQYGLHLELSPLGARALLGLPAAELASWVVDLADVFGARPAAELVERLHGAGTWPERFAVLDAWLSRALREAPPPAPEVARAWAGLVATGGTVEIGALAKEVGWSRRHLGERFRRELGLAPKAAARVLRFERARRLLERPGAPGLAAVAAACGYYDQAHLTREWRELAGCTPTAWLAEERSTGAGVANDDEASLPYSL